MWQPYVDVISLSAWLACWRLEATFPSRLWTETHVVGCCGVRHGWEARIFICLFAGIYTDPYVHTYVCEYVHNARLLICFQWNFWLRHFWRIENKSYTICMLYKYLNINNDWLYDGKTTKFVVEWLEGHTLWHILVLLLSVLIKIIVLFFPFPPLPIRIVPLDVRCCEWCSIIITTNKKTVR